jgi:hypothetical protein
VAPRRTARKQFVSSIQSLPGVMRPRIAGGRSALAEDEGAGGRPKRTLQSQQRPPTDGPDRDAAPVGGGRGPGLSLVGQPDKRGMLRQAPSPEELLLEADAWFRNEPRETVRSTRLGVDDANRPALFAMLHPAARDVALVASETGRIILTASTAEVGPGYHTFLSQLVRRLGTDLEVTWALHDGAIETDELLFEPDDRASVERALLGWLMPALNAARTARAGGADTVHLGLPAGTRFTMPGALLTVLGPRDDAWLETAIRQPLMAVEVWPWWSDATDARYLLNRALCLMWTEVRWRAPGIVDEAMLIDEVRGYLRRAHGLDPSLPYPWREWAELLRLRGGDDPLAERITTSARRAEAGPLIGYRRSQVTAIHEGWSLSVPGSFAERRGTEEWWGGEAGRSVTLAAVATGTEGGRPMPPEMFLSQVAGQIGEDAIQHRLGPVVGKARLTTDTSSGIEVAVLDGYSAVVGSGAAVKIVFDNPADWEWALETWRSLQPA